MNGNLRGAVCVVTAGREEVLRCWLAAWRKSPNAGAWTVRVGDDGGLSDAFKVELARAGCLTFDMGAEARRCVKLYGDAGNASGKAYSRHHSLWASKVAAMRLAPLGQFCNWRFVFWLDHDCEVRGDLMPIVEEGYRMAAEEGKWISAPHYASFGTGRFAGRRMAQFGLAFVDRLQGRERLVEWEAGMERLGLPNDEASFHRIFGGWEAAVGMIGDLYRPEWYASPDTFPEIAHGVAAATRRMERDGRAVVRHWCANVGKRAFARIYGGAE